MNVSLLTASDAVLFRESGPTVFHSAIEAADSGRHVLALGPVTATVAEYDRLADHCKRRQVALITSGLLHHRRRYQVIRRLIDERQIGEPMFVRFSDPGASVTASWNISAAIDLVDFVVGGTPERVHAGTNHPVAGGESGSLSISLVYPSGATALLALGAPSIWPSSPRLLVLGRRGSLEDVPGRAAQVMVTGGQEVPAEEEPAETIENWLAVARRSIESGALDRAVADGRTRVETAALVQMSLESGAVQRRPS